LAFKQKEALAFKEQVTPHVTECLFRKENQEWYKDYYRKASENASAMLARRLHGEDNNYLKK